MAGRYCMTCGAPLRDDSAYCERCGTPVPTLPNDATAPQPAAVPQPVAAPQPATAPQPAAAPQPATAPQPVRPAPQVSRKKPGSEKRVGTAVIVVVAVAIVAAGFGIGRLISEQLGQRGSESGESQEAPLEEPASEGTSEGGETSSADETTQQEPEEESQDNAASDEEFHAQLASYYNALSGYDSRIRSCATSFNNDFLKTDYSLRQNDAQACYDLEDEIRSDIQSFDSLEVPEGSAYASQYEAIGRCLDDLLGRISCIADSWDIDLGYGVPSDHKDEILGPIAAENVDGTNRSLTDYESVYPTISL